jgi:hypothetical protein
MPAGKYELRIVDVHGTPYASLGPGIDLQQITTVLDDVGEVTFQMPTRLAPAYFQQPGKYEIQIWRTPPGRFGAPPTLMFWGPITKPTGQGDVSVITVNSPEWYFKRRFFGRAGGANRLQNGYFSGGLFGGSPNYWGAHGVNVSVKGEGDSPAPGWPPNYAHLTLSDGGATAPEDACLRQVVPLGVPPGDTAVGATLTALFYIKDFTGPAGPGHQQRGLYISVIPTAWDWPSGTVTKGPYFFPLSNASPRGSWQVAQIGAVMPAGMAGFFDCRLYCPDGTINWAGVRLVYADSLATSPAGEDQATTMARICSYAQGGSHNDSDGTKGNLNIVPYSDSQLPAESCPLTGKIRIQAYQFADHGNILEALQEYPGMQDGADFAVELTSSTVRTFHTYALAGGGKGAFKPNLALVLHRNCEIADSSPYYDGDAAASVITEMGPMTSAAGTTLPGGPARYEGRAINDSLKNAAGYPLDLELVESAPTGTSYGFLDDLATRRLNAINGNAAVPVLRCYGEDLYTGLDVGDTVPVDVVFGWIRLSGIWRVTQIDRYPDQGDVMDITINPPPVLG